MHFYASPLYIPIRTHTYTYLCSPLHSSAAPFTHSLVHSLQATAHSLTHSLPGCIYTTIALTHSLPPWTYIYHYRAHSLPPSLAMYTTTSLTHGYAWTYVPTYVRTDTRTLMRGKRRRQQQQQQCYAAMPQLSYATVLFS
eukprot:GHVU01111054.1.p3 GENE.GHVU01111054.1~~GHVU01111054.1.p3  ORF type:complete len:140 (-),score=4.25 GHVU01111054.1:576-995(-)